MSTLWQSLSKTRRLALGCACLAAGAALAARPGFPIPPATVALASDLHEQGGDRVSVASGLYVGPDETVDHDAVAILGNSTIDGTVRHDAVAVAGNLTVNGTVEHDAVSVMGNVTVNGIVRGDVVSSAGSVNLGPNAEVDGKVVAAVGSVNRGEGSVIRGGVVRGHGPGWRFNPRYLFRSFCDSFFEWPGSGFLHVGLWRIGSVVFIGIAVLLALVFPGALRHTGDQLVARPGLVVLCSLLFLPALPVVCVLLAVTLIGIPFIPFVLLSLVCMALFGKASLYGLIGRSVASKEVHPVLAVVIGGLICLVAYMVPFLGFLVSVCLSFLGVGCALTALFGPSRAAASPSSRGTPPPPSPPPPAPVPPSAPPPPAQAADAGPAPSLSAPPSYPEPMPPTPAVIESSPPPVFQAPLPPSRPPAPAPSPSIAGEALTLPRAGFWIRIGALVIDGLLLVVFAHFWILAVAIYAAVMWKLKGSTVGGLIFGLKVVRMDGRPVEWDTAIVRAVLCYLSAVVLFLGFFWIAFDDEKQAWHDKIAGTVVVRTKGLSLV